MTTLDPRSLIPVTVSGCQCSALFEFDDQTERIRLEGVYWPSGHKDAWLDSLLTDSERKRLEAEQTAKLGGLLYRGDGAVPGSIENTDMLDGY